MKFYKCDICGKIIAIINETPVDTICCGQPMRELIPGTTDGATEKHLPVSTITDNLVTVKVGSVDHPMLEAHYIQWIAIETDQGEQRKLLNPGDKPEATFALSPNDKLKNIYEYCNIHGLWKS